MSAVNGDPARRGGSHASRRSWWTSRRGKSSDDGPAAVSPPEPGEDSEGAETSQVDPAIPHMAGHDPGPGPLSPPVAPVASAVAPGEALTIEQKLSRLLTDVRASIPWITGAMVASEQGLPICHDLPESEVEMVAAMAANALALATRITEHTGIGPLLETVVRGAGGYFVVYSAGSSAVLVLAGPPTANLGAMRIEARRVSAHVSTILE